MLSYVPRGTQRQLSYYVWQSLNRVYLSFILLAEPLPDEGNSYNEMLVISFLHSAFL